MGSLSNNSWSRRVTLSGANFNNTKSLAQTPTIANPRIAPHEPTPQSPSPEVVTVVEDRVVARASSQTPRAVAHQPDLQKSSDEGTALSVYLNATEISLVEKLPRFARDKILSVNPSDSVGEVRTAMNVSLKQIIDKMVPGGQVKFQGVGNRDWDLQGLLNLARSIDRMPTSQRQQLAGVTFERAARFEQPEGMPRNLLTALAEEVTAGKYDIQAKKVILYDRGTHDDFPAIGENLRQSLRNVAAQGKNDDIKSLQHMLNPYLEKLNHPTLTPDGAWGQETEKALRVVQMNLLSEHLQANHQLTTAQRAELTDLAKLAASPHFDMITRMTDIRDKMENLQLLPDTQMKALLEEFSGSDFGATSMQFILQDISQNFRSSHSVDRADEVLTHEMGHHFQLGTSDNMSFYVKEFSKLGQWLNTDDQTVADGTVSGAFASEDMMDVYNVLASDGTSDEGFYRSAIDPEARSQHFVSSYAATDPMEDFAESYKTFLIEPEVLMKKSPEKFFFMNAMPAMQAEQNNQPEVKPHYDAREILEIGKKALTKKWGQAPNDLHVQDFVREKLESVTTSQKNTAQLKLSPQSALSIYNSHQDLLHSLEMPTLSAAASVMARSEGDASVYAQITDKAKLLIRSRGENDQARQFFSQLRDPAQVQRLFPEASEELKENLSDKAFTSMTLALGEISGHATFLNEMWIEEDQDQTEYKDARNYFSRVLDEPTQLFSRKIFSHAYNSARSLGTKVYNPETNRASASIDFFEKLKANPAAALESVWDDLPESFQEKLQDQSFIKAISGSEGRYMPSGEAIQNTLEEMMSALEYQRMMDKYREMYE